MKDDVEILATVEVTAGELEEIESQLREWGLRARSRRLPPHRGAATELTWIVLLTLPAEVVVRKMLERLGEQAFQSLRGLVQRVLERRRAAIASGEAQPARIVIESASTGAQFALEPDLPLQAYRQLFHDIGESSASDHLRVFDREALHWTRSVLS